MNLEEIAGRIKNPQLCGSNDIDELRQLSVKYPYAQVFSLLYLKALSINNDVRFDDELQLHAYRITDRVRLYELINEKGNNLPIAPINETIKEVEGDLVEIKNVTISEIQVIEDDVEQILEEEIIPETENLILSTQIEEDAIIEKIEITADVEIIEIPVVPIIPIPFNNSTSNSETEESSTHETDEEKFIDPVEELNEIVSLNELLEVKDEIEKEEFEVSIKENDLEIEVLSHAISSNFSILDKEEEENEENVEVELEVESDVEIEITNKVVEVEENFKVKTEIELEIESEPEFTHSSFEKNTSSTIKKGFSSWLKANNNENKSEEIDQKDKINTLVNQFLKEEPSISRPKKEEKEVEKPKAEFFSPVKKARKSLDENTLPVSETLAKIFAAQGNFPKAIYAYEQLIAINPEKKIFFANQITELTKKLNT